MVLDGACGPSPQITVTTTPLPPAENDQDMDDELIKTLDTQPNLFGTSTSQPITGFDTQTSGTPAAQASQRKVTCMYCDKAYNAKSLKKHIKNVHRVVVVQRNSIDCGDCNHKFSNRKQLIKHLQITHNKEVEIKFLNFSTYKDFESWLETEENLSCAKFIKPNGERKSVNGSVIRLLCSRDKEVHGSTIDGKIRKRALKRQGSKKTNRTCTSHLIVNKISLPEKKVCVQYTKTHYGHERDVQHLQLSKSDRDYIASQLFMGVSEEIILKNVTEAASDAVPSRIQRLKKKDLANIRKSYGIGLLGGRRDENEMVIVDKWVTEAAGKENNSVRYYKKYGDKDDECRLAEEDFCLVIITNDQIEIARKYAERLVCVDSTHGLGGNDRDIQLSTTLVVDEYGKGFPIGFMYCNKTDQYAFKTFFEQLRKVCGVIKTNFFVSVMADSMYNVWRSVMGVACQQLLCSWHVLQSWHMKVCKVKGSEEDRKESVFPFLKKFSKNFSCSCCKFILEITRICKPKNVVGRNVKCEDLQNVEMEISWKRNETTEEGYLCERSVNNYSKSDEEEFKSIYEEIGGKLQHFNNLPTYNKKQAIWFLKAALLQMQRKPSSLKTPFKTVVKGKRKIIPNQEVFGNTVKFVKSIKKKRKINTRTTVGQCENEISLHVYEPRLDNIIDHEEVVS